MCWFQPPCGWLSLACRYSVGRRANGLGNLPNSHSVPLVRKVCGCHLGRLGEGLESLQGLSLTYKQCWQLSGSGSGRIRMSSWCGTRFSRPPTRPAGNHGPLAARAGRLNHIHAAVEEHEPRAPIRYPRLSISLLVFLFDGDHTTTTNAHNITDPRGRSPQWLAMSAPRSVVHWVRI